MTPNGLELNKFVGALLLAGVIAMVSGLVADQLYHGSIAGEHGAHHEEAKRGYTIEGAEEASEGAAGGVAGAEAGPVDINGFLAKADVEAGKAQAKKCAACHTFDKGGKNGVGPNQYGLVGAHFGHADGFAYSEAIAGQKDKHWDFQTLSDFLTNPKKAIPGNKMSFAGIKNPQDRANLIAYLNTLSDSPLPLPAAQ